MTDTTGAKSAADSLTLRSLAAIAVAFVANHFRLTLPDGAVQDVASTLIDLVTTLGLIGAAIGRARASGPIA